MNKNPSPVFQCALVPVAFLLGRQNYLPAVENLDMLKANVLQYGIRVPLLVSRSYRVTCGAEILLAACAVGIARVPVLISPDLPLPLRKKIKNLHYDLLTSAEWDAIGASLDDSVIC